MLICPIRRPVLLPTPCDDHLVVAPERAVHEQKIGAGDPLAQPQSSADGAVREIDQPPPSPLIFETERVAVQSRRIELGPASPSR